MIHNLQLNLDKTRIIHGEEKAQKSSNDFSLSFSIWPHAPPLPSLSLFLSLNLSLPVFVSFLLSFCLLLHLTDKALGAQFWAESPWGSELSVCLGTSAFEYIVWMCIQWILHFSSSIFSFFPSFFSFVTFKNVKTTDQPLSLKPSQDM